MAKPGVWETSLSTAVFPFLCSQFAVRPSSGYTPLLEAVVYAAFPADGGQNARPRSMQLRSEPRPQVSIGESGEGLGI